MRFFAACLALLLLSGCASIASHQAGRSWNHPPQGREFFVLQEVEIRFLSADELQAVCLGLDPTATACVHGDTIYMPQRAHLVGTHTRTLRVEFTSWKSPFIAAGVLFVYDPPNRLDECEAGWLLADLWGFTMGKNDFCDLGHEAVFHVAGGRRHQ